MSSNLLMEQANVQADGFNSKKGLHDSGFDVSRDGLVTKRGYFLEVNSVRVSLSMKSKREAMDLRRKLEGERDMIRSLMRKIEANEVDTRDGDKVPVVVGQPLMLVCDNLEKEKRKPKANKLYKDSEFLLANDKIPIPSKKFPNGVLKSCRALLDRLMKHNAGWVFNKPVDAVGLGLHDYFEIIKNPMDLGTVKDRLTQNWYKSPMEFAEDVRLTFQNAMTYNPKPQAVHVMAEQLLKIFEDKWPLIEVDYMRELKRTIDKSESTTTCGGVDPERKTTSVAQSDKVLVKKKPKAKDANKREMTYDEKQKLSINLQNLPSQKLENVVQIIKKRNPSVSQQDDEIEVDIDCVDTETLWELDRFITNYNKSLNKNKRKADTVSHVVTDTEHNTMEKITTSAVAETPKESRTDEEKVASPPVAVEEPDRNDTNQGARLSSSSSDSGSSSNGDSDGDSSSADGSDGER